MIQTKLYARPRASATADVDDFDQLDATVRLNQNQPFALGPRSLDHIQNLGPYRLVRQLGCGGMGIVFEAQHVTTLEDFAIKVLRPTLSADPDAKLRFSREAQAMAAIDHSRIVPVVEVGKAHGIPYIVMPLLRGETLEDRLQRGPKMAVEELARIGIQIAEGLDAAHQLGLIHRDIKPANVWLEEPFGSVRLLDLGLVRAITKDTLLTHSGIVMGTPAYMSPEQSRGAKLDARSDLFSLGCLLYQMAVGVRPFDGPTPLGVMHQLETYHPPRVSVKNPAVPIMLSNLVMELLAKQAKDRPASAAIVMDRLRRIPLHEPIHPLAPLVVAPRPDAVRQRYDHPDAIPTGEIGGHPVGSWLFFTISMTLAATGGFWLLAGR